MTIKIYPRNLKEVQMMLSNAPHGTKKGAIFSITEYFIGNDAHGLKHYPAQRSVSRQSAYGVPFFSDKQRGWFFANLKSGGLRIPYSRTSTLKAGWEMKGGDYSKRITNSVPYATLVMGDAGQSRHPAKIGWRKVGKVLIDNMAGALHAGTLAVARWIKQHEVH